MSDEIDQFGHFICRRVAWRRKYKRASTNRFLSVDHTALGGIYISEPTL